MKKIVFLLPFVLLMAACQKSDKTIPASGSNTHHSITYNGNANTSGTVPVDGNSYMNGSSAIIMGNDGYLDKTGYSFVGWNTTSGGTGTDYVPGDVLTMGNSNI